MEMNASAEANPSMTAGVIPHRMNVEATSDNVEADRVKRIISANNIGRAPQL